MLSYQPNVKQFHEFITLTPEGLRYRNNYFKSINSLFKWFKLHFNDQSTFPRTPGPTTPVNASPYTSQRTPVPQTSPFVGGSTGQPQFAPTPNINPQAIQRAAAAIPSHIFNTLSQVAGQHTPSFNGPPPGNFAMPRPGMFPPPPAPPLNPFQQPPPPPNGAMPPPPPPPISRPGSRSGNQWAEMIQSDWRQQPQSDSRRSNPPHKPRTPIYATPGASSAMSISPVADETPNIRGDQTPLVDEWNY